MRILHLDAWFQLTRSAGMVPQETTKTTLWSVLIRIVPYDDGQHKDG